MALSTLAPQRSAMMPSFSPKDELVEPRRNRTPDLFAASEALSQLSYGPILGLRGDVANQHSAQAYSASLRQAFKAVNRLARSTICATPTSSVRYEPSLGVVIIAPGDNGDSRIGIIIIILQERVIVIV
jgi:hypothetical protein